MILPLYFPDDRSKMNNLGNRSRGPCDWCTVFDKIYETYLLVWSSKLGVLGYPSKGSSKSTMVPSVDSGSRQIPNIHRPGLPLVSHPTVPVSRRAVARPSQQKVNTENPYSKVDRLYAMKTIHPILTHHYRWSNPTRLLLLIIVDHYTNRVS